MRKNEREERREDHVFPWKKRGLSLIESTPIYPQNDHFGEMRSSHPGMARKMRKMCLKVVARPVVITYIHPFYEENNLHESTSKGYDAEK